LKVGNFVEYRKLLADFTNRLRLSGGFDRADAVLSIMVKIGPYVGLRPCEWLQATIANQKLHVVNAKNGNGRALGEFRAIELRRLPLKIVTLVSHLIGQVRLLFAEGGSNWRKILGRLGERLARVCARIGIPRWSLYTTRHVAIANWKRTGLSDAEIAALAGHSSTRTARQHYAGGRHGWTAEFARVRPDPDLVAAIVAHNGVTTMSMSAKGETVNVAPVLTAIDISEVSAVPAAIVPTIKNDVVPMPYRTDTIWEVDEEPALVMG
jgi:integrase